jgi:hypothetical protein
MIAYTLVRSAKRKTMAISIGLDLEVVVRAPSRTPKAVIDDFVAANESWILRHRALQQQRRESAQIVTPEEEQSLRQKAKAILPGKVEHYSKIMGLIPTGFHVTGARTRLGSCSGKNSLSFSFRLMAYPDDVIDYVVVHELAHIRHKNHGPAFYGLIEQYLPDYRERIALLKDPQYRIL